MKKGINKLISVLLCMAVFLCSVPLTAYADDSLANVGTNAVARMKSNQHTAGNQFVISVNTKKLIGTNTTVNTIYKAYMIYTDGTNQFVVYSDIVTDSAYIE